MAVKKATTKKSPAKKTPVKKSPARRPSASRVPVVKTPKEIWKEDPDAHDYPAAESYLALLMDAKLAKLVAKGLKKAPIEHHPAKDLLRASHLELLPADDPAVMRDFAKVKTGEQLSPVLIVRGDARRGIRATIADGYHRVCSSYHLSENEQIPCRIIDYPNVKTSK